MLILHQYFVYFCLSQYLFYFKLELTIKKDKLYMSTLQMSF